MLLYLTIAALCSLLSLTGAAPMPDPAAEESHSFPTYYFKSEVVQGPSKYNDLYLVPYHTGAGENAASMYKHHTSAAYINTTSTELIFDYGGTHKYNRYPVRYTYTDSSMGWGYLEISVASASPIEKGFYINDKGHLINKNYKAVKFGFAAPWKVCTWNHGVPELFWNNPNAFDFDAANFRFPDCADVNLKAVPA